MKQPNLGKRISGLRKAKGLTQEELAEQCKISARTLQRIESGVVAPRAYTVRAIFAVLGCELDDFSGNHKKDDSLVRHHFEQACKYLKDLFNLKTNTMKKVSILSVFAMAVGFGLFALCSESKAQKSIYKNHFQNTSRRGFQWFLPSEKEYFSSHEFFRNDTLFVTAGKYLIKEYNGNVYLNDQFAGCADEGDTVILHKATFFKKTKLEFRRIEYKETRLPNGLVLILPKNLPPQMQFQVHKTEDESRNKIFLNGVDRGEIFASDTVILKPRGTLIIKNSKRD